MTLDEIYPPLEANPNVVMLIQCGLYPRRCYPVKWHGFKMRWQVHNYCRNASRRLTYSDKPMWVSLWLETEIGNDILLGQWENEREIYIKDPATAYHYKTGERAIL